MLSTPFKRKIARFYWRYEPVVLGAVFGVILALAVIGLIIMWGG